MRTLPCVLACLLAAPALAEDGAAPLSAPDFDALTRGKVMDTYSFGEIYGVEKFLPGGKSIWEDAQGCMYGTWEQVGDQICFTYEDDPANPDCWTYFDAGDGRLTAQFQGDPLAMPIELTPSNRAMTCNEYLGA